MKWLNKNSDGVLNFDEYFAYIDSIKGKLPKEVYEFASNWGMYSLDSHSSLHDCWLESFVINETGHGDRNENRECSISVSLFGAYHDRIITLEYSGVERYSINAIDLRNSSRGHTDLSTHEIRVNEQGLVEHEIGFVNESSFEIVFTDLRYKELRI